MDDSSISSSEFTDAQSDDEKDQSGADKGQQPLDERTRNALEEVEALCKQVETLEKENRSTNERLLAQRKEAHRLYGFYFDIPDRRERLVKMYICMREKAEDIARMTPAPHDIGYIKMRGRRQRGIRTDEQTLLLSLRCILLDSIDNAVKKLNAFKRDLCGELDDLLGEIKGKDSGHEEQSPLTQQVILDLLHHGTSQQMNEGDNASTLELPPLGFDVDRLAAYKPDDYTAWLMQKNRKFKAEQKDIIYFKECQRVIEEKIRLFAQECAKFAWNWILFPSQGNVEFSTYDIAEEQHYIQQKAKDKHGARFIGSWPGLPSQEDGYLVKKCHLYCKHEEKSSPTD